MTESQFTSKLLKQLREYGQLNRDLVWKVSDRFNAGRPDVQVIWKDLTTYFELKVLPNKCTHAQEYFLKTIARAYLVNVQPKSGLSSVVSLSDYGYSRLDMHFKELVSEIVRLSVSL